VARKWSEETSDALGLNAYAVRQNVATLHQMLKSMGLSERAAYGMSTSMTELAYDMASFFNLAPEEAFEKLRAGITGEAEPLKRLGILIDEATIKQTAWNAGLVKTGQELTQTQKVQARYLAIMKQTSAAQGDLARTAESPANQIRRLQEEAKETAIEFGRALIPVLKAALPTIRDFGDILRSAAEALNRMDPETRKLALSVLALVAAAGPLTRIFGTVFAAGGGLAKVLRLAAVEAGKLAKAKDAAAVAARKAAPEFVSMNIKMAEAARKAALLRAGLVGLAAAAGVAIGTAIRPWVNEVLGLNEAFGLVAEKNQDLLEGLMDSREVFENQLHAYNAARESLGLLGDEWAVAADHTKENAGRLAHLLTKLEEVRAAHLAESFAVRRSTEARGDAIDQVNRHLERIKKEDEALASVTEDLREMYGILSRKDVIDRMDELVADFSLLARDGASGAQLMEKFAPKVAELAEAAKGYSDLDIPNEFSELQWVLEQGVAGWVDTLATRLGRDIPDNAAAAGTALESSIGAAMFNAKKTVDRDTQEIRNLLAGLAGEEWELKVKAALDTEDLMRKLQELGLEPDTTGTGG